LIRRRAGKGREAAPSPLVRIQSLGPIGVSLSDTPIFLFLNPYNFTSAKQ